VSIGSGYFLALIANTFRVGLFLKLLPLAAGRPWLHEVVGTAVFLSFLITYGLLLQKICPKTGEGAMRPHLFSGI
jgi:hypothetical protein